MIKHTEEQAKEIANKYKNKFPSLQNKIKRGFFNEKFNVEGGKAWIVIGEFELFSEIKDFFYVISDATGIVEYTYNEHGTINPHLIENNKNIDEWEKLNDE